MLVQDSEFYLLLFLLLFSLGSLLVSPVRGVLITPELQYVTDKVKKILYNHLIDFIAGIM